MPKTAIINVQKYRSAQNTTLNATFIRFIVTRKGTGKLSNKRVTYGQKYDQIAQENGLVTAA